MIMELIYSLTMSVVLTEAVTELLVKSGISNQSIKKWLFDHKENKLFNFLHNLLDCGYCTSVWIGTLISIIFIDYIVLNDYVSWIIFGLIIHRMSNIWHFVIDRIRG